MARRYNTGVSRPLLSVLAGLALALLFTASPVGVIVLATAPAVAILAARRLDRDDRRVLFTIFGVALLARLLAILALFALGIPEHNDLSLGSLTGDQAYNISRSLRTRDILRGFGGLTHYDYFVTTDEYGRTSYISLLTLLQYVFGPSPFGLRLLNALMFVTGAAILFRTLRPRFGMVASSLGLVVVVVLPSLFYASISVLKEPLYFLASSVCLAAAIGLGRRRDAGSWIALAVLMALCIWILDDLRRGAVVLSLAGLACGVAIRVIGSTRWPLTTVAALLIASLGVIAMAPSLQQRALTGISSAAKQHTGHVFTRGHAYKLLDDGFYMNPVTPAASRVVLTPWQAARFVARAAASFILTPLPWEARSLSERAYLPEHLLWYLLVLMLPFGVAEGWRRDPWATSMVIGFVLPTAAALAMTNGNVGTLLRLRGLVTPYIAWVSMVGFCAVAEWCCARWRDLPGMARVQTLGSGA